MAIRRAERLQAMIEGSVHDPIGQQHLGIVLRDCRGPCRFDGRRPNGLAGPEVDLDRTLGGPEQDGCRVAIEYRPLVAAYCAATRFQAASRRLELERRLREHVTPLPPHLAGIEVHTHQHPFRSPWSPPRPVHEQERG